MIPTLGRGVGDLSLEGSGLSESDATRILITFPHTVKTLCDKFLMRQ